MTLAGELLVIFQFMDRSAQTVYLYQISLGIWSELSCALTLSLFHGYRKTPNFSDAQNVWCNHPKIQTKVFFRREICPKGADGMANSVDPDQTAPLGAV